MPLIWFIYQFYLGFENQTKTSIYVDFNEEMEKWTTKLYIAFKVTVAILFIPKFLISYFLYFTTDLNGDAFNFPFLLWYVKMKYILYLDFFFYHINLTFTQVSIRLEKSIWIFICMFFSISIFTNCNYNSDISYQFINWCI